MKQKTFCSRKLNFTWRQNSCYNTPLLFKQYKTVKKKEKIAYVRLMISRLYIQLKLSNNGCDVPIVTRRNDIPCLAPSHIFLHVIRRISGRRVLGCVHLDRHREIESLSRTSHLLSETSTCMEFDNMPLSRNSWKMEIIIVITRTGITLSPLYIILGPHLPLFVIDNTIFAITNY